MLSDHDTLIVHSVMKCLLTAEEDENTVNQDGEESLNYLLRQIQLLFEAMDNMDTARIHKEGYNSRMSTGYNDEDFIKYLEESDDAQVEELVRLAGVTLDASKNHSRMSTGYDDEDFIKHLEESGDAQVEEFVRLAGAILDACKKKKTKTL